MGLSRNARPTPVDPLLPLPVPLPAVPEPEATPSKLRVTRRHTRRLHAARMGAKHLPWKDQHPDPPRCSACGCEQTTYTEGCGTCSSRRQKRGVRGR